MRKFLIITFLLSGFYLCLYGQNMHVSYFSEANGLPSNEVRHVAQDTLGFLWIATDNGLLRYDGFSFHNYSQYIPSRYGRHFCHVKEGLLLSHDAGISLIKPGRDSTVISLFLKASIDPNDSTLYYPDQIFQHSNGDLWVSEPRGGVHKISKGKDRLIRAPVINQDIKTFFCEATNNQLWVADGSGGIYFYDTVGDELIQSASLPAVNDMKSQGNELWIAGDQVYRIRLSEDGKQIIEQQTFFTDLGDVTSLAMDSKGNIFLGISEMGLYFLDRKYGRKPEFIKIFGNNDPHQLEELPFKNIHNLVLNSNDKLWVCSSEGLGLLQRRFFESLGSLPNANTNSISVAENGKIFVNFGDIYAIERNDFGYEGTALPATNMGTVTAMTTANNHLWTGTSTGILFELNQDGRQLRSIDLRERGEGMYFLNYDSKNRLWVCQAPEEKPLVGIGCILPDGSLKEYGIKEGLQSRLVCIRETSKGRFYAAGHGKNTYLYRYLPKEESFVNLSLPMDFYVSPNFQAHDLTVDDKGIVWLATTDGLLRYDMDRITRVDLGDEFQNVEVRAVVHMSDGSIWISFDTEGILRYKNGETIVLKEESGLPDKVMTYRCLVSDKQSRLWVGTAEGVVFSLNSNPEPSKSNKPLLISASIDGEKCSTINVQLTPDQSLSMKYIAPAFHGFRTFYQYRLNDGKWSEASTSQNLILSKLEPADYIIEIRSRQEGGYLWSDTVKANILVYNHWFNYKLLIWILVILLFTLIYFIFHSQKRKFSHFMKIAKRGLEEEKEMLKKRDADLSQVREEIKLKQRQSRANLLILDNLHKLISKVSHDMKWDTVLEIISLDILKLPGVAAFEIGIRAGNYIEFEGYAEHAKDFVTDRTSFDPSNCLAAYCIYCAKSFMFHNLEEESKNLLGKRDKRLDGYKSAISVPFYLNNKNAIFSIYSDKENLFDDYGLKAMKIFATYLEQIA